MADQGVKLSEIIESVSIGVDADYLVGTRKNNDGTFTDFRYKASLISALAATLTKTVVITLSSNADNIVHPNLVGASKVWVYSVGGSRLRDNSMSVWDSNTQSTSALAADPNGIDNFSSPDGKITFTSTHVSGETFIVDYL